MALVLTLQRLGPPGPPPDEANYALQVWAGPRCLYEGLVVGHRRADGWQALLRKALADRALQPEGDTGAFDAGLDEAGLRENLTAVRAANQEMDWRIFMLLRDNQRLREAAEAVVEAQGPALQEIAEQYGKLHAALTEAVHHLDEGFGQAPVQPFLDKARKLLKGPPPP